MSIISMILVVIVAFLAGIEGVVDEFQFHQPLVACTLIGLVTGNLEAGIVLGGSLQMIALRSCCSTGCCFSICCICYYPCSWWTGSKRCKYSDCCSYPSCCSRFILNNGCSYSFCSMCSSYGC